MKIRKLDIIAYPVFICFLLDIAKSTVEGLIKGIVEGWKSGFNAGYHGKPLEAFSAIYLDLTPFTAYDYVSSVLFIILVILAFVLYKKQSDKINFT